MVRHVAVALACLAAGGCAHHQNQYAYAPPLAPPVYPQPQQQPAAAPAVSVPHPTQPGVMPPPAGVPGPMPPVSMAPPVECCPPLGAGEVVVTPVVYEHGQTPACPPAGGL